ncbi:hypothetical protein GCM10010407_02600 [Rarobacter incanus]
MDSLDAHSEHGSVGPRNPLQASVLSRRLLSGTGSRKQVWQVALSASSADLGVVPGDSIGVLVPNRPGLVDAVLEALGMHGDEGSPAPQASLREWLRSDRELSIPPARLLRVVGGAGPSHHRTAPADPAQGIDHLPRPDLLDILSDAVAAIGSAAAIKALRPLRPRAYSVSSAAGPAQLTVARLTADWAGRKRVGVASSVLCDARSDDPLRLFALPNPAFHLPADGRPLIMVAAGTGVAPFRGFIQQLAAGAPTRRSWLMYGERTRSHDFIFEDEFRASLAAGILSRMTTVFSRQGDPVRYVHEAIAQHGSDIDDWIRAGARVFVCGSQGVVSNVRDALVAAIGASRGWSPLRAEALVAQLEADGAYLADSFG